MNHRFKLFARHFGVSKLPIVGTKHAVLNLPMTKIVRFNSSTPMNTVIVFVPHQQAWIVERMGKFHKTLNPGFNILLPIIDKISYVQQLKELIIEIPEQSAVTSDNVMLKVDGNLTLQVQDPYLASYSVDDPEFALIQLAKSIIKLELGKLPFDKVFKQQEEFNKNSTESINKVCNSWGINCVRYEIGNITLPTGLEEAIHLQLQAERKKQAVILESEASKEAEINIAIGKLSAQMFATEAAKQEVIDKAKATATALVTMAEARARSLEIIANTLNMSDAKDAAAYSIAEEYVKAFDKLAKVNNTLIVPSNVSDVSSVVTQAMTIYKQLMSQINVDSNSTKETVEKKAVNTAPEPVQSDEAFEYFSDKEEAEKHARDTHKDTIHKSDKRNRNYEF